MAAAAAAAVAQDPYALPQTWSELVAGMDPPARERFLVERAGKVRNTCGVVCINKFTEHMLVVEEDRNDWEKCPRDFKEAWEKEFKGGNAPHTVYYWTKDDSNVLFRVDHEIYLTRKQVLTCAAMHMIKKNWIPTWAPDTITKDSTFPQVAALSDDFYVRLSNTLAYFTALIPWAITFPAENLTRSEKTALLEEGANEDLLGIVANRANEEEACLLPIRCFEAGHFLLKKKRKPEDPDKFTYVHAAFIDAKNGDTFRRDVMQAFANREKLSDWRCAHGYFKFFGKYIGDFNPDVYENEVKAFRETRNPRLMTPAQIRVMGDKKTRLALKVREESIALGAQPWNCTSNLEAKARKKRRAEE